MAIHELDKLSNLKNLKFRGNPILENRTVETARQLIIARIAKLKVLNGKEILHDERRDVSSIEHGIVGKEDPTITLSYIKPSVLKY
ncbi:tubulin-specific chaperone E-like isoform X1 [Mycetomoellerius zeteki]|uniref:tubulin-specific chaperone E-like isoform X1 n=1 Tax=Mycetomoellerius zeteki TaxID=64791 RepID=UPI00084E85E3|nr:PREDICTED: tubulin-specific chaperone E-like isoform X1 [Trachymyrmex zeteki]